MKKAKLVENILNLFLPLSLIVIFDRIEELNTVLHSKSLHYQEVKLLVDTLTTNLKPQRNSFDMIWNDFNVDGQELPRMRKIP